MTIKRFGITALAATVLGGAMATPGAQAALSSSNPGVTAQSAAHSSAKPDAASNLPLGVRRGSGGVAPGSPATPILTPSPAPTEIVAVSSHGFDWGDAAIGAGAGFALAMISVGGVLLVGSRRSRRAQRATAV